MATIAKILICDLIGLAHDNAGRPDPSEVRAYIESLGCGFYEGSALDLPQPEGRAQFYYLPMLAHEAEILAETADGRYDAVIAAATFLPEASRFDLGGVRIGTGTGNMGSRSWGGGDGKGGIAPLMNTPAINARATAQMAMKAMLAQSPDLHFEKLHDLVAQGRFDTGRDLVAFPTRKLEGQTMGLLGYGNIGRELAKLARAFGMKVQIYARPRHREWIEAEGFVFAPSPEAAAAGADVLSVHLGLGPKGASGFANAGIVAAQVLEALADQAILLNFDRGELVDIAALGAALASGKIAHAAIDADLFVDAASGATSGPMQPYLALLPRFDAQLTLLPHAAADTDHPTRVAGAKQAVDQILAAIERRELRNLKGDLPEGYRDTGATRPLGLGGMSPAALEAMQASGGLAEVAELAGALQEAIARMDQAGLMLSANRLAQALREKGLEGPLA